MYGIWDNAEQQHQFTQEFRFASSKDKPLKLNDAVKLDWQAGVFVFNQDYRQNTARNISSIFNFFPASMSTSSSDLGDSGIGDLRAGAIHFVEETEFRGGFALRLRGQDRRP